MSTFETKINVCNLQFVIMLNEKYETSEAHSLLLTGDETFESSSFTVGRIATMPVTSADEEAGRWRG